MIDFPLRRIGAIACAFAMSSLIAMAPVSAQAADGPGARQELRRAALDFRADNRDLRREFRQEQRRDVRDLRNGAYDSAGEFVRDRQYDRLSTRQQHRIDVRDFRQDLRQIRN